MIHRLNKRLDIPLCVREPRHATFSQQIVNVFYFRKVSYAVAVYRGPVTVVVNRITDGTGIIDNVKARKPLAKISLNER